MIFSRLKHKSSQMTDVWLKLNYILFKRTWLRLLRISAAKTNTTASPKRKHFKRLAAPTRQKQGDDGCVCVRAWTHVCVQYFVLVMLYKHISICSLWCIAPHFPLFFCIVFDNITLNCISISPPLCGNHVSPKPILYLSGAEASIGYGTVPGRKINTS